MSDAQGRWKLTIDTPMGERTGILELKVEGDRLWGSLSDGEHHAEISEGRIHGRELTWSAKIHKPMRLTFKFTAVLDNDRISGAARHLLGSATFTGVRA